VINPFSYCFTVRAPLASAARPNGANEKSGEQLDWASLEPHLAWNVTPSIDSTFTMATMAGIARKFFYGGSARRRS
jgi:hypothetical protein